MSVPAKRYPTQQSRSPRCARSGCLSSRRRRREYWVVVEVIHPEVPVPSSPLPSDVLDLLAKPNPAVMATIAADGRPVTVATWYLLEDEATILLGLDAERARLAHLRRDPRVSLTVLAADDWYTHVSVQGRIGDIAEDVGLQSIDRLARHYTGAPYRNRERPRVSVHLHIERWHGWSAGSPID
jgi:PPOX class probable F420-dependent enzyme